MLPFIDLQNASDRFYSDDVDPNEAIMIDRFGYHVTDDGDFDSTDADIVVNTPEEAEYLQVSLREYKRSVINCISKGTLSNILR